MEKHLSGSKIFSGAFSFRDTRRHLASDISDMDFHVEAFARVSLSHHERLVLENQFGFRNIVEKHAVK